MEDAAAFTGCTMSYAWPHRMLRGFRSSPDDINELIIAEDDNTAGRAGASKAWAAYRRDGLKLVRKTLPPFEDLEP
jgi:hypothetical protein